MALFAAAATQTVTKSTTWDSPVYNVPRYGNYPAIAGVQFRNHNAGSTLTVSLLGSLDGTNYNTLSTLQSGLTSAGFTLFPLQNLIPCLYMKLRVQETGGTTDAVVSCNIEVWNGNL